MSNSALLILAERVLSGSDGDFWESDGNELIEGSLCEALRFAACNESSGR